MIVLFLSGVISGALIGVLLMCIVICGKQSEGYYDDDDE